MSVDIARPEGAPLTDRPRPPLDVGWALVMVGLPARGKTFMARKIARYLSWLGYACQVFNVGNYRRATFGAEVPAEFFDPANPDGVAARTQVALTALDDVVAWHRQGGQISIYDATNSTKRRRTLVRERLEAAGLSVLFVESICDDPAIIEANIRATKLRAPDYANMDADEAVQDFRARIANYEKASEPLDDDELSYIKVIDVGRQLVLNRIKGYLPGRIVNFLMNLHLSARPLWLTRHGESLANVAGCIGGDEGLSLAGREFAGNLAGWVDEQLGGRGTEELVVWTSTLQRTIETASALRRPLLPQKALDEIGAGVCDGLTYAEIERKMPGEFAARRIDKLAYRYPQGESYEDVIRRVDPMLIELERQEQPVLVVAHQAVLRALFGYFTGAEREAVPHLRIPLHTVLELIPRAYGCEVRAHKLGPKVGAASSS